MALQIIVDGYNYIGKHGGLRGDIEGRREDLIRQLARYQAIKGHPVTVVFDGGRSGWGGEHGEIREGIQVVFSSHGESADQVICRMANELGNACVVVSSDREVGRSTQRAGGVAIRIGEFEERLRTALSGFPPIIDPEEQGGGPPSLPKKSGNPRRLSKEDRRKQVRLNKL